MHLQSFLCGPFSPMTLHMTLESTIVADGSPLAAPRKHVMERASSAPGGTEGKDSESKGRPMCSFG